jgi:hypothetical protein
MKWMVLGSLLAAACASHGGAGDSTGGLQMHDGGVNPLPGEKCGAVAACSNSTTKTYQQCQAAGPPCVGRFITSDNQTFNCASCSDCMAAAGLVTGWCGPGDAMCAMGGNNHNDCITCCQTAHMSGSDLYTMTYQKCLCDTPGDCALDCQTDFCQTGTIGDPFCQICIQQSTCDPTTKCRMDSDCSAFIDCAMTCPAM